MTSRLPLLLSLGLGVSCFAQGPLGEAYWQAIRAKADSVLVAEFGKEFREKHIFTPTDPLDYAVVSGNGVDWDDRDTVTVVPEWCYFEYCIGLDEASATRFDGMIRFTITPEGGRVPASREPLAEWNGFVDCSGHCRMPLDLDGFVKIARDHGVRARKKDGPWAVVWVPPDSLAQVAGDERGRYELRLAQYLHRKGATPTSGGGAHYWKVYRFAVFDLLTGSLLRVEEKTVGYKIVCGAGNL
jgi:hypothetical protein